MSAIDSVLSVLPLLSESPELTIALDLAILLSGQADKPVAESPLKMARRGHPNATAIITGALASCECDSCGVLEECPSAKPSDFARRDALRCLARLLGMDPTLTY